MNHSFIVGAVFGVTSGIITTVGLMIGVYAGTQSRIAVMGAILTIAIADAFSDALGIHISEESENVHTDQEVWLSTFSTFIAKFFCAISFLIPIWLFDLNLAVWINVVWGLGLLSLLSFFMARSQKKNPTSMIFEHVGVAIVVIILTYYLGRWVASWSSE